MFIPLLGRFFPLPSVPWDADTPFHQGVHLLETFARDNRIRIRSPKKNLQIKMLRALPGGSEFVAYLDALGEIDGQHCLIDWKTTSSRYSTEPDGLLSLDPQLICYSWISGISEVALVVFVRKHAPEIQYLRATISEEQRQEFGRLVETTIGYKKPRSRLGDDMIENLITVCVGCHGKCHSGRR